MRVNRDAFRFTRFVNFAVRGEKVEPGGGTRGTLARAIEIGAQGAVPGEAELARFGPVAELVGALAAHPHRLAGARDRFGLGEPVDEMKLAGRSPAVMAGLERDGREADA